MSDIQERLQKLLDGELDAAEVAEDGAVFLYVFHHVDAEDQVILFFAFPGDKVSLNGLNPASQSCLSEEVVAVGHLLALDIGRGDLPGREPPCHPP